MLQHGCLVTIVVLAAAARAETPVVDCNANGHEDSHDTAPMRFESAGAFALYAYANDAALADFDGDGDLDVAIATDDLNGAVAILLNNGAGAYGAPTRITLPSYAHGVVALDYDRDGRPDLAAGARDSVVILHNEGEARFVTAEVIATDDLVASLDAADFNRDGGLDVVAGTQRGTIVVLTYETDVFWSQLSRLDTRLLRAKAAQLNADDAPDLVLGSGQAIALNHGDGTFADPIALPLDFGFVPELTDVAVGDLDGDLDADLAIASNGVVTNRIFVALNNGDGTFAQGATLDVVPDRVASQNKRVVVTMADVDGDGHRDLAVGSNYTFVSQILRNTCNATFLAPEEYFTGIANAVQLRDLNGDGKDDLAVASGRWIVSLNDGTGAMQSSHFTFVPSADRPEGGPEAIVAADFDGDGDLDLATAERTEGTVSILQNLGERAWAPPQSTQVGGGPSGLAAADFDGDGHIDLAVANRYDSEVVLLRNTGAAALVPATSLPIMEPYQVLVGRFGGDAAPDLVAVNTGRLQIYVGLGNFQFAEPQTVEIGNHSVVVADLDGDGLDEIVVSLFRSIGIVRLLGDGPPSVETIEVPYEIADEIEDLVAADFDHDGTLDVLGSQEPPFHALGAVTVLFNDGRGGLSAPVNLVVEDGGTIAAGDLDADGRPDLVIGATMFRNYGIDTIVRGVGFVVWPSIANTLVVDLDGDTRPDIVTANSGSGVNGGTNPGGVSIVWNDSPPAASRDCNLDGVPDECQVAAADCNENGVLDRCEVDTDADTVIDACDRCPHADDRPDSDGDGVIDCLDGCPSDSEKITPGFCGCFVPETDSDLDGRPDCVDPPDPLQCVGNCDGGPGVTVDELIRGVNVALGVLPVSLCEPLDANGSGTVTVNELITAVNNTLFGCCAQNGSCPRHSDLDTLLGTWAMVVENRALDDCFRFEVVRRDERAQEYIVGTDLVGGGKIEVYHLNDITESSPYGMLEVRNPGTGSCDVYVFNQVTANRLDGAFLLPDEATCAVAPRDNVHVMVGKRSAVSDSCRYLYDRVVTADPS